MRSDARRNRDQILTTARELFLQCGTHVPMEEIATAAGVGVGTLYRHFPDRYDLLKGVAIQNMARAVAEAEAALAEEPDGWSCLARMIRRIHELGIGDPVPLVLPQLIERARSDPEFRSAQRAAGAALGTVLDRARADGAVRPDLGVADLLTLALARPDPVAVFGLRAGRRLQERHLRIVLDGLRPHGEPLPGPVVDDAALEETMGLPPD
jgi:AcrR family transcriptional regulator